MILRAAFAVPAFIIGLATFAGAASAQNQPRDYAPPPVISQNGSGSYQATPLPPIVAVDNADDDISGSFPEPQGQNQAASPYYGDQAPPPVVRYEQAPPRPQQQQPGFGQIPILGPLLSSFDGSHDALANDPRQSSRPPGDVGPSSGSAATVASLPPEDQPETDSKELPPQFKRQLVDYSTREPVGTIIIDTPNTYLYLVLGGGKAMRYGIGVGREGFTWAGTERISRMAEWPDWHPPAEMIERQPYLPRFMAGGDGNPLGARAMYLGKTLYRIHGTNQPSTIGTYVSSGCIRLINEDVADLYSRVQVGTRVIVLPGKSPASAQNTH